MRRGFGNWAPRLTLVVTTGARNMTIAGPPT
jgi:hypothetical protein